MTNKDYKIMKYLYRKPHTLLEISLKFKMIDNNDFNQHNFDMIGSEDYKSGTQLYPNNIDFMQSIVKLNPHGVELVETERRNRLIRWIDRLLGFLSGIAVAAFSWWLTVIASIIWQ